jgi:hypothetical protein
MLSLSIFLRNFPCYNHCFVFVEYVLISGRVVFLDSSYDILVITTKANKVVLPKVKLCGA